MNRTEYLETLTEQIHYKKAREMIREEITAHIEDQKEAYLLEGKGEEEAEEMAVKEMGNPVEAGLELNKVHRPKKSLWMRCAIMVLVLTGILMQTIIFSQWDNAYIATHYYKNTIFYNLLGLIAMKVIFFCDYRLIGKYVRPIYGIYLVCALLLPHMINSWSQMLLAGKAVNMLFVPVYAAFVYEFRGEKWKGILKSFALLLCNTVLLLLFGYYLSATHILCNMACLITMLAAAWKGIFGGERKRQTGVLAAVIIGIPVLFLGEILFFDGRHLFLADYQIKRIQVMINPSAFEKAEGFQMGLVRSQISGADLLGGGSLGEIGKISGAWSEYVLTCVTSYFGILAASVVALIAAAFFLRALHISVKQKNRLGFLIGVSCSSLLIMKTGLYIAMNFGVGPTIGIDMPFLTYGLSNTLMNFLFIGLIMSVYRNTNLLPERKEERVRFRLRVEKMAEKNL